MNEMMQAMIDSIVVGFHNILMPLMVLTFIFGATMRVLIYYTIKREDWFAREFEKRVHRFMDKEDGGGSLSFYILTKKLLERTYYELFEIRAIMKRRKPDTILAMSDRVFLIQHGAAWFVKDTLKQIRFLKYNDQRPKLLEIAKNVFQNNPCFSRVFGLIPISVFDDLVNVLPGIFIVGGIFGTFLGVTAGLPELAAIDLNDVDGANAIMNKFLINMAYAMSTPIVGISLSVLTTFFNSFFSAGKLFVDIVERYENCLDIMWDRCDNNIRPENMKDFDEHMDPIEALASESINNQLSKDKRYRVTGRDKMPSLTEIPKDENEVTKIVSGDNEKNAQVGVSKDIQKKAS